MIGKKTYSHILTLSILPLLLNNFLTPMIILAFTPLTNFIEKPTYYIYMFGFILWPIYHIFLAILVIHFLNIEQEDFRTILGVTRNRLGLQMAVVFGLVILSFIIFQIIEPYVSELIYGPGAWIEFIKEYKEIPSGLIVYGILVTSLTAGVCEELVWRGYLLTRFQILFKNRIWFAIVLQAILFGLWHSLSVHTIFTAFFGLIYGLVYIRLKMLTPIVVSHWLGDVIGFFTMFYT